MSHRIIAAAGAAFIIGLSAAAQAQDVAFSTSPVAITSCSVDTTYDSRTLIGPLSFGTAQLRANNNLNVGYIDKNNVPATSVTVVLSEGNVNQTLSLTEHLHRTFRSTATSRLPTQTAWPTQVAT